MRVLALLGAAAVVTVGCGGSGDGDTTLRVLAAASLTEVFTELGERFEATRDDVDVEFSFGPSSTLADQAAQGAPGDVLAAADASSYRRAEHAGAVDEPRPFARNRAALFVAPGNPEEIRGLVDLARDGLVWVRCAPQVPCGRLADEVLAAASISAEPDSYEDDVKAVVAKVALGEADAGIVYVTDVAAAGERGDGVAIPDAQQAETTYEIGGFTDSAHAELAREWVEFVTGAIGRDVLVEHGFVVP